MDQTARRYSEEMGLPPSDKMLECYRKMSQQFVSCPDGLDNIKAELCERNGTDGENAYYCSYPSFIDIYRLMARRSQRSGQPMCLMPCTLVDYEGKIIQNQEKLKARSELLKKAIGHVLRRAAITRWRISIPQFFLSVSVTTIPSETESAVILRLCAEGRR